MNRTSIAACLLAAVLAVALGGCAGPPPPPVPPPPLMVKVAPRFAPQSPKVAEPVLLLEQGWTPELIRTWYWKPQGSQLVPYDWFLALEQVGNDKPFRADDVIDRFRYLPEAPGPSNPDGLPVGFAKGADDQGRAWLGFTCAACHTGQVEYKGKRVRIEGGPALGDLATLRDEMIAAFKANLDDEAKFARFASKVLGKDAAPEKAKALRDEVQTFFDAMVKREERSRPRYPEGFGRVDAYTILRNEMTGTVAGEPANYRAPVAPVSYPFLWGAPKLEWVQWNGSVQNAIARNDGEVLIAFGHADATVKDNNVSIRSTGKIRNLVDLEEWTKTLAPPRWPEEVLGAIDRNKARKGGEVYRKAGCATCHADKPPYPETPPNKFGKTFTKVVRTPLAELKTDPTMAENFLSGTAKAGKFAPLFQGATEVPAWQMVSMGLVKLIEGDLPAAGLSTEEMLLASGDRDPNAPIPTPADLMAYKSGPLAGIWATAPYLHNGSVSSLYQLLLPSDQRPKGFYVGSRQFDPKNVGFESTKSPGGFEFRTEVPGNGNSGHDYGTTLPEDDRRALVEYLKTL
jgi:mono/diheme cytochrome c family protein